MRQTALVFILEFCLTIPSMCSKNGGCLNGCCPNFTLKNGTCVECIGSFGNNCTMKCKVNTYGAACRKTCYCDKNTERCDAIVGCCKKGTECQEINKERAINKTADEKPSNNETFDTATLIISLLIIALVICCAAGIYPCIRSRLFRKDGDVREIPVTLPAAQIPENTNCNEPLYDLGTYSVLRESKMISDENENNSESEIRYSDHLCRHPTNSSGHCQICEAERLGMNVAEDYSKMGLCVEYNELSLKENHEDMYMYVSNSEYTDHVKNGEQTDCIDIDNSNTETDNTEKHASRVYHVLCKLPKLYSWLK